MRYLERRSAAPVHCRGARRVAVVLLLAAATAHGAGGNFAVDDADIVEYGRCQVETWHSRTRGNDWETVVAPACQFVRDLDVTLEWIEEREAGDRERKFALEGKRLLASRDGDRLLVSVVARIAYDAQDDEVVRAHFYAPVSVAVHDRMTVHANLGLRWHDDEGDRLTWGIAGEWQALSRLSLVGEVFGAGTSRAGQQVGVRPILIEDRLHLDFAVARDLPAAPEGRTWYTVGLAYVF